MITAVIFFILGIAFLCAAFLYTKISKKSTALVAQSDPFGLFGETAPLRIKVGNIHPLVWVGAISGVLIFLAVISSMSGSSEPRPPQIVYVSQPVATSTPYVKPTPEITPTPEPESSPTPKTPPTPTPTRYPTPEPEPPKPTWYIQYGEIQVKGLRFYTLGNNSYGDRNNRIYAEQFPSNVQDLYWEMEYKKPSKPPYLVQMPIKLLGKNVLV